MIGSFACLLFGVTVAATPLTNGDFQNGLQDWSVRNTWYEKPKGAGLSEVLVAPGEGYQAASALKILGNGKRGIAMQNMPVFPGRFHVTGWVKCENLTAGKAGILAEWIGRDRKYLRGEMVGETSGTADWKLLDKIIEAPPEARSVHLDLLTTEPNRGAVWFSHVTFERLPSNFAEPKAPALAASTPAGQEGCLEVTWDLHQLTPGTCRLVIYCKSGDSEDLLPKLVVDSDQGKAVLESLELGRPYAFSAVAVNGDGKHSPMGTEVHGHSDRLSGAAARLDRGPTRRRPCGRSLLVSARARQGCQNHPYRSAGPYGRLDARAGRDRRDLAVWRCQTPLLHRAVGYGFGTPASGHRQGRRVVQGPRGQSR